MNLRTSCITLVALLSAAVTAPAQSSLFDRVLVPADDRTVGGAWFERDLPGTENPYRNGIIPVRPEQKVSRLSSASLIESADSLASTGYDLQTNATMMDRIINWGRNGVGPDGIKSTFIYMASLDLFPNVPDRGTYGMVRTDFGGGEGSWLPINLSEWERIETTRSGFCDIDYFGSGDVAGQVVAVSHANDNSGINLMVELDVAGSGEFLTLSVPGTERGLWPRVAVDGTNTIHIIWTYQNDDALENQLRYVRTTNLGTSWDGPYTFAGPQQQLRGVNGGDAYQIDAEGNNVALWYFTQGVQILQIYSNSNGEAGSWSASLIANAAFSNVFTGNDGRTDSVLFNDPMYGQDTIGYVSDTVATPGSSFDMMVLSDGSVLGAYPQYPTFLRRYLLQGEDTTAWAQRGGIITRDPNFEYTDRAFRFVRVLDDGIPIISSLVPLPEGVDNSAQFLNIGNLTIGPGKRFNYEEGRARWPQIGIDASNQVFILYGSGEPGDVVSVDIPGFGTTDYYRSHMYAVRSTDNGESWTIPQNLSPTGVDAQFGSMSDWIDDEVHIVVQADTFPGTYVNHGDTNGLRVHPPIFSNIETMIIPTSSFAPTSVRTSEAIGSGSALTSVSPNPASMMMTLSYTIGSTTDRARLELVDATGRVVTTYVDGRRVAGEYTLTGNVAHLPSGQYRAVLTVDGISSSTSVNVIR